MSPGPQAHTAVHLRCFLCDHELPVMKFDECPPPLVVSRKFNSSSTSSDGLSNLTYPSP